MWCCCGPDENSRGSKLEKLQAADSLPISSVISTQAQNQSSEPTLVSDEKSAAAMHEEPKPSQVDASEKSLEQPPKTDKNIIKAKTQLDQESQSEEKKEEQKIKKLYFRQEYGHMQS